MLDVSNMLFVVLKAFSFFEAQKSPLSIILVICFLIWVLVVWVTIYVKTFFELGFEYTWYWFVNKFRDMSRSFVVAPMSMVLLKPILLIIFVRFCFSLSTWVPLVCSINPKSSYLYRPMLLRVYTHFSLSSKKRQTSS